MGGGALRAAPPVDVVSVDLAPLIDSAAASPSRFAVDVPHAVSTTSGEWTRTASVSTWTYSVQIPGAVSMSFHATDALLPSGATLTVTADDVDYVYTSKDARGGDLWSRIGRGDSLTFALSVAAEDVGAVRLEIASFQAGYRSLGDGVPNHAHYDGLRKQALATTAPCAQNWTCNVTATNLGPGDATAALIISNMALCTGVLLNDVPNDGAPYILTARHCQNGSSDGGAPYAASSIVVYWNAVSACGSLLGTVYDAASAVQYGGATTVVEQQDMWLVRLRDYPAVDAYYAGWDATGGSFVGGFTPHHAGGTSRQFVGWYGQAVYFTLPPASLGVRYTSTFWGTVNGVGAGGPGSSGGGLFNDAGRLVGTLVRGQHAADDTGVCPTNPPAAPTQADATALSTALSGTFSSTDDPGSSTGTTTLRTVLDPGNTGKLVVDGTRHPIAVTLTTYSQSVTTGSNISLDWSVHPATASCMASGGEAGDGWAGAIGTQASKLVTSFDGGDVVYTITCTDGPQTGSASLTVHWTLTPPDIAFSGSYYPDYGAPFELGWSSNVRPCTTAGGNPGDGWGGSVNPSGHALVTENVVGQVTYTITCGSGTRVVTRQFTANVQPPFVSLEADAATLRLGEVVNLSVQWHGGPCAKTGGTAGDGWAGPLPLDIRNTTTALTETTPGSYTLSLACGSGSYIATAQVTVTFRNDPPAVSIHLNKPTAIIDIDAIDATWDANLRPCQITIAGPTGAGNPTSVPPLGSTSVRQGVIGQYTIGIACGTGANTAQASATMTFTGAPSVSLDAPSEAVVGTSFSIFYSTNVLPCTASGGTAGDFWSGQFSERNRFVNVVEADAGRHTYTLTCGTGSQTAASSVSVDIDAEAPQVTITPTPSQQVTGRPVTLSWSSNRSPCQAYGGSGTDGWPGNSLGGSGSITVTEQTAGNYTFWMSCGSSSLRANNYVSVQFADIAAPTLTVSKTEVTSGDTVTLTWSSADGSACFATAGGGLANWYGSQPASGTASVRMDIQGTISFSLVCGASLPASVNVKVNALPAVAVTLTASAPLVTAGEPFVLTWTIANADICTASGGAPGDAWTGITFTQSGSQTLRATTGGQFVYTLTCTRSSTGDTATASATIEVPQSAPAAGGGGGGGGGGSIGPVDLAFVAMIGVLSYRQRRQTPQRRMTPS